MIYIQNRWAAFPFLGQVIMQNPVGGIGGVIFGFQAQRNTGDDSTASTGMFKNTVPIPEFALFPAQNLKFLYSNIIDLNLLKNIRQFHTIRSDILHRCRSNGARDECQVFDPSVPFPGAVSNQFVPVDTGTGVDSNITARQWLFTDSRNVNPDHCYFQPILKEHIAPSPQNKVFPPVK